MDNGVMLQGFEWDLPSDGLWWRRIAREAGRLRRAGFSAVWLPPAFKGAGGKNDVGYGVYDLYDLGEFNQKGTVATKYGTRQQYLRAIRALHAAHLQALPDIVLNHRLGADERERVEVCAEDFEHRNCDDAPRKMATLYSRFTFPGRAGRYSGFVWDASCFTGTDWDESAHQSGLYRIAGKRWAEDVDGEHGNFDYLMGLDVDTQNPKVREELHDWARWYLDATHLDGFRLDAVKHISAAFYRDWLSRLREETGRELFAVGEYWHADEQVLLRYLGAVEGEMSLFDVPLHYHLREAALNPSYPMDRLFEHTLVGCCPCKAVTFVDNHDTQPGQALESWVPTWFKTAAYGLLLLRSYGYPCVFWGDWAGLPSRNLPAAEGLATLLRLRQSNAYGCERDYFDHAHVIGLTREGDDRHAASGLAFLCTNGPGGAKRMCVGKRWAGRTFVCALGKAGSVRLDGEGCGMFSVPDGGSCVWIPQPTSAELLTQRTQEANRILADAAYRLRYLVHLTER